jgi:hypothetical protein
MSIAAPRPDVLPLQHWLKRYWPSVRLGRDPLEGLRVEGRYAPVSIANWKLTPPAKRELLRRRIVRPLTFGAGRLTVVVPFRDRAAHLAELVPALSAKLAVEAIEHRILVVEQEAGGPFNRGKLLNIGMHYAAADTDYYCLHDVDAIPVVANYRRPSQPLRLMSAIIGAGAPARRPDHYFSGAVSILKEQAYAANGFSNEYWGWGKEDDDFFYRLLLADCLCYFDTHGVFHDLPNPNAQQVQRGRGKTPPYVKRNRRRRSGLLRGLLDPADDGLSTLRYEVLERSAQDGYEKIRVRC